MTKPTKWHVRPAKIRPGIRPDWSGSSLSARKSLGSLAIHWVPSEDTDQTGRMPSLIWVFAGRTCHFVGFIMRRLIYFEWNRNYNSQSNMENKYCQVAHHTIIIITTTLFQDDHIWHKCQSNIWFSNTITNCVICDQVARQDKLLIVYSIMQDACI